MQSRDGRAVRGRAVDEWPARARTSKAPSSHGMRTIRNRVGRPGAEQKAAARAEARAAEAANNFRRAVQMGQAASSRSSFAEATICPSASSTSGQPRVLRPQSGFTQRRSAGTTWSALRSSAAISSRAGTRGEWMS